MKNKIITSEGNIQFIDSEGKVINISPSQVYSVINEDTVSFILVHLPKSSGLSLFTTKVEDLELNGATYSQSTIADALAEAFSEAGAVGRIEVVDELPSEGKTNTIYLLPKDEGEGYDEYIYIKDESKWELIGDTSVEVKNYLKKSDFNEYSAATKTAIDSKQDTLIAGENITISGNVISAEGGKAIEAGRGISVTTGETADTVSFNLPISAGTGNGALIIASDTYDLNNKATGDYSVSLNGGGFHSNYAEGNRSLAEGADTKAFGESCHSEGHATSAGTNSYPYTSSAHAEGAYTHAAGYYSHAEGYYTKANNSSEHASGRYNNSVSATTTFGDSGNTLFSVGNGTADNARHNAFEIRQNGDIYISKDGQDIKLQDNLGVTASSAITSGDTNAVAGGAVYDRFDEVEQVTAAAFNNLDEKKLDASAYTPTDLSNYYDKAETNALLDDKVDVATFDSTNLVVSRSLNDLNTRKLDASAYTPTDLSNYYNKTEVNGLLDDKQDTLVAGSGISISGNVISAAGGGSITVDSALDSGSTNPVENRVIYNKIDEVEQVTAAAFNNLDEKKLDASAYTPTDLSNYYDKTEVDGLLDDKLDVADFSTYSGTVETNLNKKQNKLTAGKCIAISTSNTISLDAAIWKGVSTSIEEGSEFNTASGQFSHAEGYKTKATAQNAHAEGELTTASSYASHAEGTSTTASGNYSHSQGYGSLAQGEASHAGGYSVVARNRGEFASGMHNISTSGNDTSKATLFSVGNGTDNNARHNAFEIKENGDIYITSGSTNIKLQDHLGGGGSITVDSSLDSGSTNPVQNKVIYNKIDEVEQVTAASLNALNDNFGGLKLMKISQTDYENLQVKDQNTLYIIVG